MPDRPIATNGPHASEVLSVLADDIRSPEARDALVANAATILRLAVDPSSPSGDGASDGLLYGLIQSGKTSVMTVTAAMAADNGFACLLILTSDNNPLYDQTLERVRASLRGIPVIGKKGWDEADAFRRQVRNPPFAVVCSKNASTLRSLLEALRSATPQGARRLPALIIDDEADQASLNTNASRDTGTISSINEAITALRDFFQVSTYLQVTATPQALFLQRPSHDYRPSFTVLSEPGPGYVGGEHFFAPESAVLRYVDLDEVEQLRATFQPSSIDSVPPGLREALYTFLIAASARNLKDRNSAFAFLCHVSHTRVDHARIVDLLGRFKDETVASLRDAGSRGDRTRNALRAAYNDLLSTEPDLPPFDDVLARMLFLLPGANIKLINALSKDEIVLDHVFNLFVGGNKLGRGVTIKNLIVSYYGRNPKKPNADTVLQHARMYGYRAHNLGVTRLFLPERVADHFRTIHQMESALRDHLRRHPDGDAVGLLVDGTLQPTRGNVLEPNSLGVFVAGRYYNPAYPLRSAAIARSTQRLDELLAGFDGSGSALTTSEFIEDLVGHTAPDPRFGTGVWNPATVQAAIRTLRLQLFGDRGYLWVQRGRNAVTPRRETQGIHTSGEERFVGSDAPTLFMFRQEPTADGQEAVWWPQIWFPDGSYWLTFSFER